MVDFLLTKIEAWITAPQVVFSSSMTNELEWEVLSNAFSFSQSLEQWKKAKGDSDIERSKAELFRRVPRDWYLIPELTKFLDDLKSS